MKEPPRITTIIPTLKRPQLLKRAIKSVLNQSYPYFQIYVCDNASGDETLQIVSQLMKDDARIVYFPQEKNIGMVKNFQFGLSRVTTPFFSFLSDDDFLLPRFFETAMGRFDQYPQAGCFAGASVIWEEKNNAVKHVSFSSCEKNDFISLKDSFPFMKQEDDFPNWASMVFRREILTSIGMLDEEIEAFDIDYIFRVLSKFSCTISKTPVSVFLVHENSFPKQFEFALRCSIEKIFPKLQGLGIAQTSREKIIRQLMDYEFHALVVLGIKSLVKKEWKEAEKISEFLRRNFGEKRSFAFFFMNCLKFAAKIPFFDRLFYLLLHLKNNWKKMKRPESYLALEKEIVTWKTMLEN